MNHSLKIKVAIALVVLLVIGVFLAVRAQPHNATMSMFNYDIQARSAESEQYFLNQLREKFPTVTALPTINSQCELGWIKKFASSKESLMNDYECSMQTFSVSEKKFYLVHLRHVFECYEQGCQAPNEIKQLFSETGEPISEFDTYGHLNPQTRLFEHERYGESCLSISNVAGAEYLNPNEVLRTIIEVDGIPQWLLLFHNFNSGKDNGCTVKSGYVIADLNPSKAVQSVLDIEFHPSTCAREGYVNPRIDDRLNSCCEDLRIIKQRDPQLQNFSAPACGY